jgi:predicted metal-binding protein
MEDTIGEECSQERTTATIAVARFLQDYVDVPQFVEYCRACPKYGKIWSCAPYSFDVTDIWRKYETLELIGVKVRPSATLRDGTYTREQLREIYEALTFKEKRKLSSELLARETETPGSLFLSEGSCDICPEGCARTASQPCRHPDLMRYSVESLGANVQKAARDLLHIEIVWPQNGKLPDYFMLVAGLLIPRKA